jgi:AcrR family transcriptional regulator
MPATKDQIADVFFRHVEHYGLAKTSVEEVARELGISKRTVYQHFHSKEDILRYVVERGAAAARERMAVEFDPIPTRWGRLERLVRELVLQGTRDWLDRYEDSDFKHQFDFGVRVMRRAYDELIRQWVAEGAEAGEFHLVGADAALTSRIIGAVLMDATVQVREDRNTRIDDAIVEAIRKLLA